MGQKEKLNIFLLIANKLCHRSFFFFLVFPIAETASDPAGLKAIDYREFTCLASKKVAQIGTRLIK